AEHARKAATDERLPVIGFSGDYGDIGVNPSNSHGTGNASGTLDVPLFEEGKLRGDAQQAQAQLDQMRARLSDLEGQISADVRDSILDIQAADRDVNSLYEHNLAKLSLARALGVEGNNYKMYVGGKYRWRTRHRGRTT